MDLLNHIWTSERTHNIFFGLVFIVIFLILMTIYLRIIKKIKTRLTRKTRYKDLFMVNLFRIPGIWVIFLILLNIFSSVVKLDEHSNFILRKISQILLILSIGWLIIQIVRALLHNWQLKLDISTADNLEARKKLTQMKMIERITIIFISVIFVSIALMSIDVVRQLGVSLLASAGVAGIILGFAAQRSVGQIFSGIQIAFTQPIRLDDVVIVEGELGRVEEVNITYVVLKLWDERRMIVPTDYFLNNPVQNWTRTTSDILGTVYLYVSYDLPLKPLREELERIVKEDPNWDGRVQNLQVTDSKQWYKELRVLVSSTNSSRNWDLRVAIREQLIDFININHPGSFAKINSVNPAHKEIEEE